MHYSTKVFISYSHKDSRYLKSLLPHLEFLERNKQIDLWVDTKIKPGQRWQDEIESALASARVAILLISIDFLISPFIGSNELPPLLTAAEAEGVKILPVILRPCTLPKSLSQFQAINNPSRPVSMMKGYEKEDLWVKVASVIAEAMAAHISDANLFKEESALSKVNPQISIMLPKAKEQLLSEGLAYTSTSRYTEALQAYDRAIALDPNFIPAYYNKARLLRKLGQYKDALTACERVIKLDSSLAPAYNEQGNVLSQIGSFEDALIAYEQAINIDTNLIDAHNGRGNAFLWLGQYKEALAAFERAIELNPQYAFAYNGKSIVLNRLKFYEQALITSMKAIELDANFADVYISKGNSLVYLKRYEEGLIAFNTAIEINPHHSVAYYSKGGLLTMLGRNEEAVKAYDKAKELGYLETFEQTNLPNAYNTLEDEKGSTHNCTLVVYAKKNMRGKIIDLYPGFHEEIDMKNVFTSNIVESNENNQIVFKSTFTSLMPGNYTVSSGLRYYARVTMQNGQTCEVDWR